MDSAIAACAIANGILIVSLGHYLDFVYGLLNYSHRCAIRCREDVALFPYLPRLKSDDDRIPTGGNGRRGGGARTPPRGNPPDLRR